MADRFFFQPFKYPVELIWRTRQVNSAAAESFRFSLAVNGPAKTAVGLGIMDGVGTISVLTVDIISGSACRVVADRTTITSVGVAVGMVLSIVEQACDPKITPRRLSAIINLRPTFFAFIQKIIQFNIGYNARIYGFECTTIESPPSAPF
jgi:hypothetical protein